MHLTEGPPGAGDHMHNVDKACAGVAGQLGCEMYFHD